MDVIRGGSVALPLRVGGWMDGYGATKSRRHAAEWHTAKKWVGSQWHDVGGGADSAVVAAAGEMMQKVSSHQASCCLDFYAGMAPLAWPHQISPSSNADRSHCST